jgi:hypothetical protein
MAGGIMTFWYFLALVATIIIGAYNVLSTIQPLDTKLNRIENKLNVVAAALGAILEHQRLTAEKSNYRLSRMLESIADDIPGGYRDNI